MDQIRTPTAPQAKVVLPQRSWLGRYYLGAELGAGGMGVVHEAVDPELQRRVAVKVLRAARGGYQAQQRLLREARAMARLAHPNVVTVHEVGTADGIDYVVMELVDGTTLARWIEDKRPPRATIVDAFVAAGRGLAAAHAASIVHRDFKPHNVLRTRDGRILVSDFGLARDASDPAIEWPRGSVKLPDVTEPGDVFGTPPYMAPEQWENNVVPATDQFAFCVSLWEALAGERPFDANDFPALRAAMLRGPRGAHRIPGRLRAILERGLRADPDERWPSMDALLAQLAPSKRAQLATGIIAAALAASMLAPASASTPPCEAPRRDPDSLLGPALPGALAELFDDQLVRWRATRATACALPESQRGARLHCLDGVLARFDAARRAESPEHLIDPEVCSVAEPPRFPLELSEAAIAAFSIGETSNWDRCARAIARIERVYREETLLPLDDAEAAARDAEACGDDRLVAEAALAGALAHVFGPAEEIRRRNLAAAIDAVARVAQPDLIAALDVARARGTRDRDLDLDVAIAQLDRAIPALSRRPRLRLAAIEQRSNLLITRGNPDDLERVRRNTFVPDEPHVRFHLAHDAAFASWLLGHRAEAHARFDALRGHDPHPRNPTGAHTITGVVLDERGHPVVGARVAASALIYGDAFTVGADLNSHDLARVTTSGARGAYELEDVDDGATVIASLGDRRSRPIPSTGRDCLVLAPTTRITGRVMRTNREAFVTATSIANPAYQDVAPIAPDGSFVLERVPIGPLAIGFHSIRTMAYVTTGESDVVVRRDGLVDLELVPPPTRRLRVTVRSNSRLGSARVYVIRGHVAHVVENVMKAIAVQPAEPVADSPGLEADFEEAPGGPVTVCAIALPRDLAERTLGAKVERHLPSVDVRCRSIDSETANVSLDM